MKNTKKIIIAIVFLIALPRLCSAQTRRVNQKHDKISARAVKEDSIVRGRSFRAQRADSVRSANIFRIMHPVRGAKLKTDTIYNREVIKNQAEQIIPRKGQ